MTQKDKQLLLKDLSARLPYGVICFAPDYEYGDIGKLWCIEPFEDLDPSITVQYPKGNTITKFCSEVKPYLRPMSSMTEEEEEEYAHLLWLVKKDRINLSNDLGTRGAEYVIDWLNAHHFDYRGLIHIGLALEAPEGTYEKF